MDYFESMLEDDQQRRENLYSEADIEDLKRQDLFNLIHQLSEEQIDRLTQKVQEMIEENQESDSWYFPALDINY